jgi:5-methylcytosine-specific restriction endonuclease McrA
MTTRKRTPEEMRRLYMEERAAQRKWDAIVDKSLSTKRQKARVRAVAALAEKGFAAREKAAAVTRERVPDFYQSPAWITMRYRVLRHYGARCKACGRSPQADGVTIEVDHIKPRSKFPGLELTFSNLQPLCRDCNQGKSNTDQIDWRNPQ